MGGNLYVVDPSPKAEEQSVTTEVAVPVVPTPVQAEVVAETTETTKQ